MRTGWAHPGQVVRVKADGTQSVEPIAQYDAAQRKYLPIPIDVSNSAEQVYLSLYGTGFRGLKSFEDMVVNVGTAVTTPTYAGAAAQYPGLDQMDVLLPQKLAGASFTGMVAPCGRDHTGIVLIRHFERREQWLGRVKSSASRNRREMDLRWREQPDREPESDKLA